MGIYSVVDSVGSAPYFNGPNSPADLLLGQYSPHRRRLVHQVPWIHLRALGSSRTITNANLGGTANTQWTAHGSAAISTTTQNQFLDAQGVQQGSLLLNGTSDYVDTPNNADFALGTSDFTIDCWFNIVGGDGTAMTIVAQNDSTNTSGSRSFSITRTSGNVLSAIVTGSSVVTLTGTTTLTSTTNAGWHHVALIMPRNIRCSLPALGNQRRGSFLDGLHHDGNSTNKLTLGRLGEDSTGFWNGNLQEFELCH